LIPRFIAMAGLMVALALVVVPVAPVRAQEAWVIDSFDATYVVSRDGTIEVTEEIAVDFGSLERHGIFRYIPYEYPYEPAGGPTPPGYEPGNEYKRVSQIDILGVDDGQRPIQFEESRANGKVELKIGDPDVEISGEQFYRIHYVLTDALNPQFADDELYWNITGNDWEVTISRSSATVTVPSLSGLTCFQGPTGSTEECRTSVNGNTARFQSTAPLRPGSGLTVVVGLTKGSVEVSPLKLVRLKSDFEKVKDFVGLKPVPLAFTALLGIVGPAMIARYWWLNGRDKWFGDAQFLTESARQETKPLFSRDTIVTEYTPPELGQRGRRLRPAEIGVLVDESADTLDVTSTIVDLAVRGYLRITEIPKSWVFGNTDYQLEKLKEPGPDDGLLDYEASLLRRLFEDDQKVGAIVQMSDLKNEFYTDLAKVKEMLYTQVTSKDKFFAGSPQKVREYTVLGGLAIAGLGAAAIFGAGSVLGAGIVGVPIVATGLMGAASAGFMPRRTALGREMFRRCLGFREYMVIAETDRQKFNEDINLFQEYLPYAMVFECVDKWAKAFEDLDNMPSTTTNSWYVSSTPFHAAAFSASMNSFSSSISSAMTSTPGGSGSSGFSGGSSGGGGGGGGGGSW